MEFNTERSLFLGIDKEGDLISLKLSFDDLNKGTKFYNPHYYMTPHGFTDIKDEETGEREAKERLRDRNYWDDLGMIDSKSFLNDYIDFDVVADSVINTDGWYMTNGEYYYIGLFEDESYYINLNWVGRENKKLFDKKNFKKLYINEEDFEFLSKIKEVKEKDKKQIQELKKIFSKYQDTKRIIKDMLEID